ncbi:hypothetical protein QJS10_CPA10g02069 [Acorus calamus]|uniref:Uncharacterized protein n=1 Tax=Acorus calamus TaxID=4465 RepID=A0AAV9DWY1_ACOCL|nr:hypothetical protein QJS10_CPA10g02069 [Acorus calamus]
MSSARIVASSPDSSTDSLILSPLYVRSGAEELHGPMGIPPASSSVASATPQKGIHPLSSISDRNDASVKRTVTGDQPELCTDHLIGTTCSSNIFLIKATKD